jgi:hypothetical protein
MRRHGITIVLGVLLALATAACGGSDDDGGVATADGGPRTTGSAHAAQKGDALKFAQCMRENGLPEFKDPGSSEGGALVPQGADEEVVRAAMEKCKQYSPNGGEPPQRDEESLERDRRFAQCMRDNGVPDFPDPDGAAGGGSQLKGVDTNSEAFRTAREKCEQAVPRPTGTGPGRTGG